MPLEPTAAWNRAFSSDPVIDVYGKITTDLAAGSIVELTSSPHSQLGHPTLIGTLGIGVVARINSRAGGEQGMRECWTSVVLERTEKRVNT